MLDLEDRLDELNQLGLHQRMRMVSGPQGPRVVLDGRPVLLLCSGNTLGLADHPRVRQAAADAAMRWGVGAGAARVSCGTMTLHRRLEERLAAFTGQRAALLFGSGALANLGVIPALARRGEVVLYDELSHCSIVDGCRLSGADMVAYRHADPDHLAWALRQCDGRATLIATDGMFGMDGDVAPLEEIVDLARRYDVRVLVDEAHGLGALGPGGRGAVAEAGLEGEIDVITGTLGKALGSYGGFASCDHVTARFLVHSARTLLHSTALPPSAAAARWPRSNCSRISPGAWRSCTPTPRRCAWGSRARASRSRARPRTSSRSSSATAPSRAASSTTGSNSACSSRPSGRPRCPRARPACACR